MKSKEEYNIQLRTISAIVISILFLIGYNHFFVAKPTLNNSDTNISSSTKQNISSKTSLQPTNDIKPTISSNTEVSVNQNRVILTINADKYQAKIDEFGRVSQYYLKEKKYLDEDLNPLSLLGVNAPVYPLEIRFSDGVLNKESFTVPYTTSSEIVDLMGSPKKVVLTQKLSSLTVKKELTFYENGHFDVNVELSSAKDFFITNGSRPNASVDSYTVHGAMISKSDDTKEIIKDGDAVANQIFSNTRFVSNFDRYYTTLFYFSRDEEVVTQKSPDDDPIIFVNANHRFNATAFIGPKEHDLLENIDPELSDVVEYGFFTVISKPMFTALSFLHDMIGNWGWSIVILTLLIKLILFPLSYKGLVSMTRMKDLAPKIKEIQAKYKGDPKVSTQKTMQLYKKEGANPFGGCLPILLQIPVFFSIYRVLLNTVELKGASWILWFDDLSHKDPYFVLPILMGITMFWQQQISPNTLTDPTQQKIMKWLPVIFTFFFITFPAGLVLYWTVNNLFTVAQQYVINITFHKPREKEKNLIKDEK